MQLVTNPKLGAFRNLVPVSPGSVENPYCSTSLCREVQLYICIPRYDIAVCIEVYCRVDQNGTGASGPRGGCARDFVNFRKKIHASRARRGRSRLTVYPPRIQIANVSAPLARPDHRKSKFGLRHDIKLS